MPIMLGRSSGQDPQKRAAAPAAPAVQAPPPAVLKPVEMPEPPAAPAAAAAPPVAVEAAAPAPEAPQEPQPAAPAAQPPSIYRQLIDQQMAAQPAPAPQQPGPSIYRKLIDQQRQGEDQLVQASFDAALKVDPNLAGEAQRVAAEIGVKPETALRSPVVAREIASRRQLAAKQLAVFSPILNRQLADKNFADIAHDDLDNLGTFERIFAQWDVGKLEFEQGVLAEKVRAGASNPEDMKRLVEIRTRLRNMPRSSGFLEGASKILGQQAASLPRALAVGSAASIAAAGTVAIAGQLGPQAALPEEVVTMPSAAAGAFVYGTLGEMALQTYRTEAGNAFLEMIEQGYSRGVASRAAVGAGIANMTLEMVGVKLLAKGAGITAKALRESLSKEVAAGVTEALTRPTLGAAVRTAAKGFAQGLSGEVVTEVGQEAVNITAEEIARRLSDNPEALTSSVTRGEIVDRLVGVAVDTATGMTLLALPGPTAKLFRDQRRATAAERSAQLFRELGATAEASKVIPRNGTAAEQFLVAASKTSEAKDTYVDGQAFADVLRQADEEARQTGQPSMSDRLEATLPGLRDRIAAAASRGEDVVIPTAQVGAKLAGTEIYKALIPHMRLDADAMSLAEAQVFRQREEELHAAASKALSDAEANDRAFYDSARQFEDRLRAELVAAGRTFELAQTEAKLARDMAIVQAKRLGVLPGETELAKLSVKSGQLPPATAMAQTDRTQTPEFRNWFGNSKVVDEKGNPIALYHQTTAENANGIMERGFDVNRPTARATDSAVPDGVFLKPDARDIRVAGDRQIPVFARMANPLRVANRGELLKWATRDPEYARLAKVVDQIDADGAKRIDALSSSRPSSRLGEAATEQDYAQFAAEEDALIAEVDSQLKQAAANARERLTVLLRQAGHDGLIIEQDAGSLGRTTKTFVVLDPTQVKSPYNRGTFDPTDPNILRSKDRVDRGFYQPSTRTIWLTKDQNSSTFLHELAHHYLHVLAQLAQEKASPVLLDDFRTLSKWFGLADEKAWFALSAKEQERLHEQFARSFEAWLFEGKAPTRDLEGVFARVARWMRRAYGTIVGEINARYRALFGHDLPSLTPEVRAVMGRMFASEQEVEHSVLADDLSTTFASQEESGLDDAAWAEHQALAEEAKDRTVGDYTRESLQELQWLSNARAKKLKALQKRHDAVRKAVHDEVDAEVRKQPVFRARHWLATGEVLDDAGNVVTVDSAGDAWAHTEGFDEGGAPPSAHALQTEATVRLLPPGTSPKVLGAKALAADGVLPDVAARMFGMESGEQLVQALATAPPLEKVVDARTDERMLAEHSNLADPQQREMAVLRAVHNEARGRLIAVDLRHVAKRLGPVRVLQEAARRQAKRLVDRMTVAEIRPRDHMQAEARAAREFAKAMKAGDIEAAAAAQQRRLLQHELAKEASAALDEIDDGIDDMARFFARDDKVATTRDIDLVFVGRELAGWFGLAPELNSTQEIELKTKARAKLRAEYPVLASRVDALLDASTTSRKPWRELQLSLFQELVEVGQALWTEAGKAKWLEQENRRQLLKQVVADGISAIDDRGKRNAPGASADESVTPSPLKRFVLKGWNVVANLKRFESWAWFMDQHKLGWFARNMVLPLRSALGRYWAKRAEVVKKLHPQVMALRERAGVLWDMDIPVPEAVLPENKQLVLRGKKELMGLLLQAGSTSNLSKALVPYGLAPDPNMTDGDLVTDRWERFLDRMFQKGYIEAADVEFVRFVWATYAELLPEDQKTHKELYGFEFHTIELRPLHTPFGTLSGGYVPAYVDPDKVQAPRPSSVMESLAGEEQNFLFSIGTGRGHTLARNPNYLKPLALDVSLQVAHMDKQLRFTYLQPAIANMLRLLRNQDLSRALNGYDREAINSVILPMLDNAALQAASRPGNPLVDTVASWMRNVSSLAQLGFNLLNSVVQLTGFSNAAAEVPARFLRAAMWSTVGSPRHAVSVAMAKSRVIWERLDQTTRILREDIARVSQASSLRGWEGFARGVKRVQQVSARVAFWPQRMLQGLVDVSTWHGAYQHKVAELKATGGLSTEQIDAEAVAHADGVVKRTQGSSNPEDLAAYEAGTPLMKLLSQFSSYSNVVLNQIMSSQPGWSSKLRVLGWVVLVPAFAEATLRAALAGVPDDDKDGERDLEEIATLYAKSLARNLGGLVPVVGAAALALAESDGRRMQTSPAGMVLQQAWQGLGASFGAATGQDTSAAQARAIGVLLTMVTGLPLTPITRAIGWEIDVETGRARKPTGPVDYVRGLVVGR